MLDELMKALGPWPILQVMLGLLAFAAGAYAIFRGLNSSKKESGMLLEDRRAEWAAYEQLKHIEENSSKQVELLSRILDRLNNNADQLKALAAAIWNRREGL